MTPQEKVEVWRRGCSAAKAPNPEFCEVCTYALLLSLAKDMRLIASRVGSMHPFWDHIFDIEAFVHGEQTLLNLTAKEWVEYTLERLSKVQTHN